MKIMRLLIIALMVSALLCGCASNSTTPTNKIANTEVTSAESVDETPISSNFSFSDSETSEEISSSPESSSEILSEPTEQLKNDTTSTTTSKAQSDKPQTNSKSQDTTSTPSSQTQSPPTSSEKPPEKPTSTEPKSAFAKPFDIAAMKSELISYGTSISMTHITNFDADFGGGEITPDGTTWLPPHETWMYNSSSASKLKQDLCDRIKRWKNNGESTYTLWFENDSGHSGDYIIYVIIG